jgi:two-component system, chemotaxis family, protein-glutamate methylesterase/glutaminase
LRAQRPIRTLLVDDADLDLMVLQRMLEDREDVEVVAVARNGSEALLKLNEHNPDVICTDLNMPVMDGLELTRTIMSSDNPKPILVVSAYVGDPGSRTVFDLLEAGAVDVLPKPKGALSDKAASGALADRIRLVSGVTVMRRRPSIQATTSPKGITRKVGCVAIGASTGGPPALLRLLRDLPADFQSPILVVQHISAGFVEGFTRWLDAQCKLTVRGMIAGERPEPGVVYFPPEDRHMTLSQSRRLESSSLEPWMGHRPAVNVTFHSVARVYGEGALGVLMTGMGEDGAEGLLAIKQASGKTLAQDEASSVVFGMARKAHEIGAVSETTSLDDIVARLTRIA